MEEIQRNQINPNFNVGFDLNTWWNLLSSVFLNLQKKIRFELETKLFNENTIV